MFIKYYFIKYFRLVCKQKNEFGYIFKHITKVNVVPRNAEVTLQKKKNPQDIHTHCINSR